MSRSEGFTPSGNILLDRHIRITEPNKADFITFFSKYCKLLGLTGCPLWFIITTKTLTSVGNTHFFLRLTIFFPVFLAYDLAFAIPFFPYPNFFPPTIGIIFSSY